MKHLSESLIGNVGIGVKAYAEEWAKKHVLGYEAGHVKINISQDGLITHKNPSLGTISIDVADVPKQIRFGKAYEFKMECFTTKKEKLKNLDFLATFFNKITIKNFDISDAKLEVDAQTVVLEECYQNRAKIIFKNPIQSQLCFSSIDSCRFVKSNCESITLEEGGFAYEKWSKIDKHNLDRYISQWIDIKDYPNIKYFYPYGTPRLLYDRAKIINTHKDGYKYEENHWIKI